MMLGRQRSSGYFVCEKKALTSYPFADKDREEFVFCFKSLLLDVLCWEFEN